MIAPGLAFAVPAFLTTVLAGVCGILFVSIAWIQLSSGPISKTPGAMYTLAASTVITIANLPMILCLPYDVQNGYILDMDAMSFLWSCFLVVSMVLAFATIKLLSSYKGMGRGALKTGSIILIVLYILGFVGVFSSC